MYYTCATCALRDRYTRHELFTSRHVASINHCIYCRNSCFEMAVPFHLTNVYALCQRLLTLIILINWSSLIKTSQFPVCKLCTVTRMFAQLGFLRRFDPKCEIHRNSIWYISFIAGKKCSIHCYRHCRLRNETLAFHRSSEIAYFMYLHKVRRIMSTSWRIRMPISRHLRRESEPWNLHFFLFILGFAFSWTQYIWSIVILRRQSV